MKSRLAIGIMSGTSLDGMDVLLARFDKEENGFQEILGSSHWPYPKAWRECAKSLEEKNLLREAFFFGAAWSERAAKQVLALLKKTKTLKEDVTVIGAHGQTLVHLPKGQKFLGESVGITIQAADWSRLSVRTGIPVVGNFRSADLAAKGEGAPLAPYAHAALFGEMQKRMGVQNIGGIGNITVLQGKEVLTAFDTGPGNVWIDQVVRWKTNGQKQYDASGALAQKGKPNQKIISELLSHPYFAKRFPKSTGWEDFDERYLGRWKKRLMALSVHDSVATVTWATAASLANTYQILQKKGFGMERVYFAGGGARNRYLLETVHSLCPEIQITTSEAKGISPDLVEALAFAYFGLEALAGRSVQVRSATGAKTDVICGQISPVLGRFKGIL